MPRVRSGTPVGYVGMILAFVALLAASSYMFAADILGPAGPFVKAVPVLILAILVFRSKALPGNSLAAFGLMVASIADFVIEFSFLGGLAAFLVAHLFYVGAFTRIESRPRFLRLIPVSAWAALVLPILVGQAGPLAFPVLLYGLVIFTMIWRAASVVAAPGWNNATIALAGAILFGISDTVLGYSRFVATVPSARSVIMGTYWGGQLFIALSFLRAR